MATIAGPLIDWTGGTAPQAQGVVALLMPNGPPVITTALIASPTVSGVTEPAVSYATTG